MDASYPKQPEPVVNTVRPVYEYLFARLNNFCVIQSCRGRVTRSPSYLPDVLDFDPPKEPLHDMQAQGFQLSYKSPTVIHKKYF